MSFSEELKSYSETRTRSSSNYVKFSPDYRVTLRILDNRARTVWKHWIPQANKGKGMAAVCPNVSSQVRPCPIDGTTSSLSEEQRTELKARRRFVVNVLDRTPVTVCDACGNTTPGKKCQFCQSKLDKNTFTPLNQVKILEQGPNLFNKVLNPIEKMYKEDLGVDITDYDIVFMTQGVGRDRVITANPSTPAELSDDDMLDPEGNQQQLWDLDLLSEPSTVEEIEAMLRGADMEELNAIRGVKVGV